MSDIATLTVQRTDPIGPITLIGPFGSQALLNAEAQAKRVIGIVPAPGRDGSDAVPADPGDLAAIFLSA